MMRLPDHQLWLPGPRRPIVRHWHDILAGPALMGRMRCCCGSVTTQVCVNYHGCGGSYYPVSGATVQVYSGATLLASCTTGSGGCCNVTTTSGTWTLKVTVGASLVYNSATGFTGTTINVAYTSPAPADTLCCDDCVIPYNDLTLTDSNGTWTLTYVPGTGWTTTYTVAYANCYIACSDSRPGTLCVSTGPGTCTVGYVVLCQTGNQFTVNQIFNNGVVNSPAFGDCSSCPAHLCTSGDPASCFSTGVCMNQDVSMDSGLPVDIQQRTLTAAWSSCSPFAWSGSLSGSPACYPVGPSVSISS